MNFQQYYNNILTEANAYYIPVLDGDAEVWGWGGELPLHRWDDDEIDFMKSWNERYMQYDTVVDGEWATKHNFEKTCSTIQELENTVNDLFKEQPSWLNKLHKVIKDFKQLVNPASHGVYKIFGYPKRVDYDGYWWVCYILDAAALTDFRVNKINSALATLKTDNNINKLFKKNI